jgi:hypothetical protein
MILLRLIHLRRTSGLTVASYIHHVSAKISVGEVDSQRAAQNREVERRNAGNPCAMHQQDGLASLMDTSAHFANVNLDASITGREEVFSIDWSRSCR